MITAVMRQHLPWMAPTVAIVLAAMGFFDNSRSDETDALQSQVVARNTSIEPSIPSTGQIVPQEQSAASIAALQSLADVQPEAATATIQPVAATAAPVLAPQAQPVERVAPLPQPAPKPVAAAQPSPTDNPAAFFGAAQANLAAASCASDLRNLAQQAKIYFPSGGLTGEATGIEQARLIGLIAQDCPGVSIQVEGHSDPSGSPQINQRLSQQRAEAVLSRIAASGIDTTRFIAKGMGSAIPSGLNGPQGSAYYDRRVEFTVIENARTASLSPAITPSFRISACAADLQRAVDGENVLYAPGSVSVSQQDMSTAMRLATAAAACPDARLRVIGQHSDAPGSGENPGTGRLRAVVMMSSLVNSGIDSGQVIIAAPSRSFRDADRPDLSDSRLDFDVILEN